MCGMGDVRLCALCRRHPVDQRYRPFCSERCRNEDLARWAEGRYWVPGEPVSAPDGDTDDSDSNA